MTTLALCGLRTATLLQTTLPLYNTCALSSIPRKYLSPSSQPSLYRCASTTTYGPPTPPRHSTNGPLSTHPPPLTVPVRAPDQGTISYYFNVGKTYAAFYKTGIKQLFSNFMLVQTLRKRIDASHPGEFHAVKIAAVQKTITREEFQLIQRNWHDVKRIPAFAVTFLICGEFTPLVVVLISDVVPWTCRIPRQIEGDRRKLETRRGVSFRNLTAIPPTRKGVEGLERQQLIHISWSVGLSAKLWDWVGGRHPGPPTWLLRRRVAKWVEYLEMDDGLLGKSESVKDMDVEEVRMALVERGVDILGMNEKTLRGCLMAWLGARRKVPVEHLLLTRPNVWPIKQI